MAVNPDIPLVEATELKRQVTVLTDMAQDDLANVISCLSLMADSDRPEFLRDLANEFMTAMTGKLRLAAKIGCSLHTHMQECSHGVPAGRGGRGV